jgi:hypothetical protein
MAGCIAAGQFIPPAGAPSGNAGSAGAGPVRYSRDLFLAQRFARRASPLTTTVYMHASDEELMAGVRTLSC